MKLDMLHVDGISLPANDGGTWLSDDRFTPLLEESDRRGAVLFVHPFSTSRPGPDLPIGLDTRLTAGRAVAVASGAHKLTFRP